MLENLMDLGRLAFTRELEKRMRSRLAKDLEALGYDIKHDQLETLTNGMLEVVGDFTGQIADLGKKTVQKMVQSNAPRRIRNPMKDR